MMTKVLDFWNYLEASQIPKGNGFINYFHIFEQSHSQQPVSRRHRIRNINGSAIISHRASLSSASCIHEDYESAAYRATGTNYRFLQFRQTSSKSKGYICPLASGNIKIITVNNVSYRAVSSTIFVSRLGCDTHIYYVIDCNSE